MTKAKTIAAAMLALCVASLAFSQEQPIQVEKQETSGTLQTAVLAIQATVDQVRIEKVIVNHDNCHPMAAYEASGRLILEPLTLKYGEKYQRLYLGCSILEARIETDQGAFVFHWPN
jgi:hypothetical protein